MDKGYLTMPEANAEKINALTEILNEQIELTLKLALSVQRQGEQIARLATGLSDLVDMVKMLRDRDLPRL